MMAATARGHALPIIAMVGLGAGLVAAYGLSSPTISRLILLATLLTGGLPVVLGTLRGMLRGNFASDIVASLAIIGAGVTGEYLAGCVIVLMQTGGEALEEYAVHRASASLELLLSRAPRIAHVRRGDRTEDVGVGEVAPGDRVMLRPGEMIPVDAIVLTGSSMVDESAVTGEPIPVLAGPGSEVMSGSICLDGALEVRAMRLSSESQYEQIIRLVQAAQSDKAPLGRLADRYAVIFTPTTLAMCALAYLLTRRPEAVVAVLVVATPCPLILATPVAIISGINRAARHGIIIKSGAAIERVGEATAVAFDKTGTLTTGSPAVERVLALNGYRRDAVMRLAAGLEQHSGHPMARALVEAGQAELGELPLPRDMMESAGQGVSGLVDGHRVEVGSVAYATDKHLGSEEALNEARHIADAADDAIAVIGVDGRTAGMVIYRDLVRPTASHLLQQLKALGVRETMMLTGDDRATAQAIAAEAGIETVRAQLLPAEKVEAVRELLQRHDTVVMVGDGINDGPALATATVGVALGAQGSAVSAEAADIVITTDDLGRVADTIRIGRHTLHIAKQSIWAGLGVSGAMMAVAALGYIPPTTGAVLQEGLDVAVILNALRAR